ncbi:MAG: AAA family ATPase [Lachnospiraceae bacterium]|nr:AAA family ATPase [Lachnospiraceae bacterium]
MNQDRTIGRKYEYGKLDDCMTRNEAQLIAVYGRRRVGKTYLIDHYFNGRFDFRLTGIYEQQAEIQLQGFVTELNNQTGKANERPDNWMGAFILLRKYLETKPKSEKVVVFFDEMPWMDTPKSGFLPAFEWFWNGWGSSRRNLVFIVCGSATSWMQENIDQNKGGLYNRLTCRLYLNPFTLGEVEEYLKSRGIEWSRYDIVECYMIMGGIPYYLSRLTSEFSYNDNIDNLFFRKRAELWDEFTFLYATLFKNSDQYVKIVETLSGKKSGMTRGEIIEAADMPDNGALTVMLNNLEYSGFVRINNIFGKKKKIYQLADYYSLFYFRFIKDNYGKDEHFWANTLDNPSRRAWAGFTYEQVCRDHIGEIKKKLGISGVLSEVSVWSRKGDEENSGAQVDLLIDRRDRVINICEIKYAIDEYEIDKNYDMTLRNKIEQFRRDTKTKSALQLTMITTYGVKRNKYSSIVTSQVMMEDLF